MHKWIVSLGICIIICCHSYGQKDSVELAELHIDQQEKYIKFSVENVHPDTVTLQKASYETVVKNRIKNITDESQTFLDIGESKNANGKKTKVSVVCVASKIDDLISSDINPVIGSLSIAYSHHRSITISPDVIWLMLMQGFAIHVNENAQSLRKKIVDFQGKKNLDVKVSEAFDVTSVFDWSNVVSDFKKQIAENVGEHVFNAVNCKFSTTTEDKELAYDITLMNSMAPYFSYSVTPMCGIPEIKLEGNIEDWKLLKSSALKLEDFDLKWWVEEIVPILDEFIKARSGIVNQEFWSKIFEIKKRSVVCTTVPYLNGWILKFFPYINSDGKYFKNPIFNPSKKIASNNQRKKGVISTNYKLSEPEQPIYIDFEDIPDGICKAKVLLARNDSGFKIYYLYSGFVGIIQQSNSTFLRPEISWCVAESDEKPTEKEIQDYQKSQQKK